MRRPNENPRAFDAKSHHTRHRFAAGADGAA